MKSLILLITTILSNTFCTVKGLILIVHLSQKRFLKNVIALSKTKTVLREFLYKKYMFKFTFQLLFH